MIIEVVSKRTGKTAKIRPNNFPRTPGGRSGWITRRTFARLEAKIGAEIQATEPADITVYNHDGRTPWATIP